MRGSMIEQARLLTLKAAHMMDTVGNKVAQRRDRDDQGRRAEHGLPGDRLGDPGAWRRRRVATISAWPTPRPTARTLRLADGPDEVHRNQIAKLELRKYRDPGAGRLAATGGAGFAARYGSEGSALGSDFYVGADLRVCRPFITAPFGNQLQGRALAPNSNLRSS